MAQKLDLLPNRHLTNILGHDATDVGGVQSSLTIPAVAKQITGIGDVLSAFIYDTTKDSDGGAWRNRCQHTSWYNEDLNTATRGSRREFPQRALLVGRGSYASTITIYDLDDASCPMWMVFNSASTRAVFSYVEITMYALNGLIYATSAGVGALSILDFIVDDTHVRINNTSDYYARNIAGRNDAVSTVIANYWPAGLVNRTVNNVSATVAPGTPINPNRGLPNPTVAVSTDGGVSVIHWDGRIYNSASALTMLYAGFDEDGLYYFRDVSGYMLWYASYAELNTAGFGTQIAGTSAGSPFYLLTRTQSAALTKDKLVTAGFSSDVTASIIPGLALYSKEKGNTSRTKAAVITDKYNTGYMIGDIKLALAESTADVTSLVAATLLNEDFSSYVDTAAMIAAGWDKRASSDGTVALVDGEFQFTRPATFPSSGAGKLVTGFIVGRRYRFRGDIRRISGSGAVLLQLRSADGGGGDTLADAGWNSSSTAVTKTGYWVATQTSAHITIVMDTTFATGGLDNVSIDLVAEDRSVAGNHPIVKGTVTRTAVAPGSELAAYGGWGAASVSLDFDFTSLGLTGASVFSISGWINANNDIANFPRLVRWFETTDGSGSNMLEIYIRNTGVASLIWQNRSGLDSANSPDIRTGWHQIVAVNRGGLWELWVDGIRYSSISYTNAITLSLLKVGQVGRTSNIALFRFSLTAPTPEQIRAIYEAERHLFQPNAKCLLPAAAVTGLAYDEKRDLLRAYTTSGRAWLKGLQVVEKDATVVPNGHVHEGMEVTYASTSADITIPAMSETEASIASIGHNGGPPLYDENVAKFEAVTTNATPTVIARIPVAKNGGGRYEIFTVAREHADGADKASYIDVVRVDRPGEGNVTLLGSSTQTLVQEVTGSMAVAISVNTTTQTIDVTATGVAAKNLVWKVTSKRSK